MKNDDLVAEALREIANSISLLGNAGAGDPNGEVYGGLERHGMAIIDAAEAHTMSIRDAASEISEGLHDVASAIRELAEAAAAKPLIADALS